jgi:hypothetical protein
MDRDRNESKEEGIRARYRFALKSADYPWFSFITQLTVGTRVAARSTRRHRDHAKSQSGIL